MAVCLLCTSHLICDEQLIVKHVRLLVVRVLPTYVSEFLNAPLEIVIELLQMVQRASPHLIHRAHGSHRALLHRTLRLLLGHHHQCIFRCSKHKGHVHCPLKLLLGLLFQDVVFLLNLG